MTLDPDFALWQSRVEDYFIKKRQDETVALIERHGGIDRWHDFCRKRRNANPDYRLAIVIGRLIQKGGEPGHWRLNARDRATLEADHELATYFMSVSEAGASAWREEQRRIRGIQNEALAADDPTERMKALSRYAIKALMPVWRTWGRVIGRSPD